MYQTGGGSRTSKSQRSVGGRTQGSRYIEEEDEEASDYDDASYDEDEFEMVSSRRQGPGSISSGSKRTSSRRDNLRTVRVKAHADDARYIVVGPAIEFSVFVEKIQEKFGLRRRFKIKIKDEDSPDGEMITMGDQDDLDMVMTSVKQEARKQRSETGKLEVSLNLPSPSPEWTWLTQRTGLDPRSITADTWRHCISCFIYPRRHAVVWFWSRSNDEHSQSPSYDHDTFPLYQAGVSVGPAKAVPAGQTRRVAGSTTSPSLYFFLHMIFFFCI